MKNIKFIWTTSIATSLITLASVLYLFYLHYGLPTTIIKSHFFPPLNLITSISGIKLSIQITEINIVFAIMVSSLYFIAAIYSAGYMKITNAKHQNSFFSFFSISIFCTLGIAFASNLFTAFIFYEMLTLVTYPLVIHNRDESSLKAGNKYLTTLLGTSMTLFLPAVIITYCFSNGEFIANNEYTIPKYIALMLFVLFNFGIAKASLITVHSWLVSAMIAPAPVSALLHAVAVVKSGIFILIKIYMFVFMLKDPNLGTILSYFAGITIIFASICAIRAKEIKQLLAYSTISQLSYMLIIASLFTENALKIAMYYVLAHAFAKITLFFCVGSLYAKTHKKYIEEMAGVFNSMPLTGICFFIGAFAMIGLPPTAIFYAKHYAFIESTMLNNYLIPMIITLSTGLTATYYFKVIYIGFFKGSNLKQQKSEAPLMMTLPTIFTTIITILLSLFTKSIVAFI